MRRAVILILAALSCTMAACGGGDDDGGGTSAKGSPSSGPSPEATATPTPTPIMFGSQRYISPCSVLPQAAVERIYGRMGRFGYVNQEFFDASLSRARFRRMTDTATRSVRTVCRYNKADRRSMTVHVEVNQFRSPKAARREWASIAYLGTGKESRKLADRLGWVKRLARENERNMGGKPVRGIENVLFVKGRADFVGVRRNALIRLSYLPLSFSTPLFGPRQYRRQAAKARKAFRVMFAQVDRADLSQAPAGAVVGREQEVNGVPYLDPCSVLDEEVFRLATGRASTEEVQSTTLVRNTAALREVGDSLYEQSAEATCARRARYKVRPRDLLSRSDRAELAVRVAARPQGDQVLSVGTELARDWIINRYINEDARDRVTVRALVNAGVVRQITADQTEADALFVFDSTAKTGRKEAFRQAFFNVGPYAFFLDVGLKNSLKMYSGHDLGVAAYRRVVDAIAARVRAKAGK